MKNQTDRRRSRTEDSPTISDGPAVSFGRAEPDQSIPGLVRQLANEGSHLGQQQLQLFQLEIRSSVESLKDAVGSIVGAAVVGAAGFGLLLIGLAFLLGKVMELWLATLIVSAAALGISYLLYLTGRKKMQSGSLHAERTRRTLGRAIGGTDNGQPMTGDPNSEAGIVEEDIRSTQDRMGETVQKLETELSPKHILRSLTEETGEAEVLKLARRNPFAVGLIAIGAIWFAGSRPRTGERAAKK